MPRQITELRIFISSPSDMSGERTLIERAASDLSLSLQILRGMQLRVLDLAQDIVPGIGRPQAVVNQQILDGYDIYIGLMGTRFGSPTGMAASGTEEEFQDAYDRYVHNPGSLRVLFYFKTNSDNVFLIDQDQLAKVRGFQDQIRQHVYFGSFSDQDELLRLLRGHLQLLIAKEWEGNGWRSANTPIDASSHTLPDAVMTHEASIASSDRRDFLKNDTRSLDLHQSLPTLEGDGDASQTSAEIDRDGLLEIAELATQASGDFSANMELLTMAADAFQISISAHTQGLQIANKTQSVTEQRRLYDLIADEMVRLATVMKARVPHIRVSLEASMFQTSALRALVTAEIPQLAEEVTVIEQLVASLAVSVRRTREAIVSLREQVRSAPPFTKKLRRAKLALISAFDEYIASTTIFLNSAELYQLPPSALSDVSEGKEPRSE